MIKIQLISSPRNISTALMYSFSSRGDTHVVDEPYYAYYLLKSGKDHPGREEIMASQSKDPVKVLHDLCQIKEPHRVLFVKNMAKHFIDLNYSYLEAFENVILIRNPYQLIASYSQIVSNPIMEDIGAKRQFDIYQDLLKKNKVPIVIDSGEVLKNPRVVLTKLCEKLNISFSEKMLQWEKGALTEDGVWAKHWYANVHKSTGFQKQKTSERKLNHSLLPLYNEAAEYYNILYQKSIKA